MWPLTTSRRRNLKRTSNTNPLLSRAVPSDLVESLTEQAHALRDLHRGAPTAIAASYDSERGSLCIRLETGNITLAVDNPHSAEQVESMVALEKTTVLVRADGPRLILLAQSSSWAYSVGGTPALNAPH